MKRIALTGGIASGKDVVAACFERLGVPVVDADVAARAVVAPDSDGLAEIVDLFGEAVLDADGALDRPALRRRIFADQAARRSLETVLHPRIRAHMHAELDRLEAAGHAYAIAVIPLLVETGQYRDYDRVLVVDAPEATQRERLRRRDRLAEDAIDDALASQTSRAERLARADDVIHNDDTIDPAIDLPARVQTLDRHYRILAQSGSGTGEA